MIWENQEAVSGCAAPARHHDIWALAVEHDFARIIDLLREEGVREENLGEALFALAKQAITVQRSQAAMAILSFLVEALEDKTEVPPVLKLIGDLHAAEGEYEKAREYYGRLPMTLENIRLFLQTFVPRLDIDGMLEARNSILSRVSAAVCSQIHAIIEDLIMQVATDPAVQKAHHDRYKKNRECLAQIDPSVVESGSFPPDFCPTGGKVWKPTALRIGDSIYAQKIQKNGIWHKVQPAPPGAHRVTRESLGKGQNIMIRCASIKALLELINAVTTDKPEFYKFECHLIIDFHLLREAMTVCDLTPLTGCDFVFRLLDENSLAIHVKDIFLERKAFFPSMLVDPLRQNRDFFFQRLEPLLDKCEKEVLRDIEQYGQQLARLYPDDFPDTVRRKIKENKKLRVLFKTSKFTTYLQYATRDVAEGFRRLGHEVLIEMEDEHAGIGVRQDVGMKNLWEFRPDIIFCIDHLRYEMPWIPKSIPFVTWVQDLLTNLTELDDPGLVGEQDVIFSYCRSHLRILKGVPAYQDKRIRLLPIPVNPEIYYPLPDCKKRYDITYVSHLYDPEETLQPFREGRRPPEVTDEKEARFLAGLAEELASLPLSRLTWIARSWKGRQELMERICRQYSLEFTEEMLSYGAPKGDQTIETRFTKDFALLMKTKPILYLLENGLEVRVFGRNWDKIPALAKIAMGPLENGEALNQVINESKINLNLNHSATFHMRAPEVMGARGFLLSRRLVNDIMPITDFFEEERETVLFDDEEELLTKVKYFLDNEAEREQVAERAYQKVMAHHTIEKAAALIIDTVASQLDAGGC